MDAKNNPLGLIFTGADWTEDFMLTEVVECYKPDDWNLTPDDVVLEVGGHTGEVSMTVAKKYGCRVFVFEPSPYNYPRLIANIKANNLSELITVFQLAVTGDGRDVGMHLVKNSGAHRIGSKAGPIVKSCTLRQALKMCKLEKPPKVLVMDCEGAEFEILEKDIEVLRGIEIIRGELHENFGNGGNIDELLEKMQTIVPDTKMAMTYIPKYTK